MNQQHLDQCPPRLQRLKLRMMQYHYDVFYVPGKQLTVADALSRAPLENGDSNLTDVLEEHVNEVKAGWPATDEMLDRIN